MKDTRDSLKFTRMCKYWKINRCNLGDDCNFAHTDLELRDQPDLVSTRLCFQFARKGMCKHGEACTFAHGRSELRRLPKTGKIERGSAEPKKVSHQIGHGQETPLNIASLAALSSVASTTGERLGSRLTSIPPLSVDAALAFRPPPGLGMKEASLLSPPPGLSSFAAEPTLFAAMLWEGLESSHRKPLLKQSSGDGLVSELPLSLDTSGISTNSDAEAGTESVATTAWPSGYPSDTSEPASPKSVSFWL